jgi:hypothetical protein
MLGSLRDRPEAVGESANLWTAQRRKDLFRGSYVSAYRWKQRRSLRRVGHGGWLVGGQPADALVFRTEAVFRRRPGT